MLPITYDLHFDEDEIVDVESFLLTTTCDVVAEPDVSAYISPHVAPEPRLTGNVFINSIKIDPHRIFLYLRLRIVNARISPSKNTCKLPLSSTPSPEKSLEPELAGSSSLNAPLKRKSTAVESTDELANKDSKTKDSVCFDNDQSTRSKFEFNAYKSNRQVKPPGTSRTYYACKESSCPAKYHIDTKPNEAPQPPVYKHAHNHHPPENPRLLPEVRKDLKRRIKDGANVGLLHRQAVLTAKMPISSATVPTPHQLHDIKYRTAREDQPTGRTFFFFFSCSISSFFFFPPQPIQVILY